MQDLGSGFIKNPPASLQRWMCHVLLLSVVRKQYAMVLLAEIAGVFLLGDLMSVVRNTHVPAAGGAHVNNNSFSRPQRHSACYYLRRDESVLSNGSHNYGTADYLGLDSFASSSQVSSQPPASASSPLLAVDDLLGLGTALSISSPPEPVPASPAPPQLKLNPKPVLDAPSFKKEWGQLQVALTMEYTFPPQALAGFAGPQPLVRHMQASSVQCMASRQSPLKFFFYSQMADTPAGSGYFLLELLVTTSSGLAVAKIKADDSSLAPTFADTLQAALRRFGKS